MALQIGGYVYVTGATASGNFPVKGISNALSGSRDAFVLKLYPANSGAASLVWSRYLGGRGTETGYAIAVSGSGQSYVGGKTTSDDFPTANAFDGRLGGSSDAFVARLDSSGSTLLYGSYLGEDRDDWAEGVALDGSGKLYVVGSTRSFNFPLASAVQETRGANDCGTPPRADLFVSKLDLAAAGPFEANARNS